MSLRTSAISLALVFAAGTARADTSATLATAINLPKGPASIEGFGQGYDVSPASGLPSLSYPIDVPPGRAGLEPQLALTYSAGEGAGVLGLGWSLGLPALERSLRFGIPRYDDTDAWVLRGLGGGEELTKVAPGVFRERIEQGPPLIVRALPGGAMSAVTTDGTGYLFGLTDDARLSGDAGDYRLELSAITDVHGNRIDFEYTRASGSTAPLLSAIVYNDGRAAVRLDYEERPDVVRTRAPGFPVALRHRLRSLTTEVDGALVRATTLTYARSVMTPASVLTRIDTIAADGIALPPWHLDYTRADDEPRVLELAHAPALDPTADGRAWVDLDGDALPDLLDATGDSWRYRKGRGDALAEVWSEFPAPAVALTKTARFADLTGDGIEDLLAQPAEGELWAFTGGVMPFAEASPITVDLGFDLTATNVALVDLNLDSRVDVLRHDDADGWIWLRHHAAPGYQPADPVPPPPAGMRLGDPGVQLADLDGDRLPDLVRILPSEGRVLVAAGEGLGLFAEPVDLAGVPAMQVSERWEFADLNGDGAADLVRLGGSSLDLYTNQHDGSVALAASVAWPALEADEVVILSDVDASGTVDVLRVDTDGSQPWRVWSLAERPGLLARVRTDLGYAREFTYTSAAALAAADSDAGAPWTTTPPTALPVLTRSHETDAHTPWSHTTEHHVRDGWYDPARGEFRGFAELREASAGDDFTEPAITTTRYDLGQTDEARKLQPLTSETASPRGVLVREEHTLEVDTPAPGVRAVHRVATDTTHLEAGPESAAARVRSEWDHDEWGNVLEERALGRVDLKTGVDLPGDERITTYIYAEPAADDGPRDRVAEELVAAADGTQITTTRTYYDGEPEQGLPLGQADARGVIARTETWLAGDAWAQTLRQRVDAHGNVTQLRDAEGGTLRRQYDDAGLFPIEERFVLRGAGDLVTTATWDARFGLPRSVTAPSGATTRAEYDGLGRLVAEIEPGDTAELPTTRYEYHLDGTIARPSIVTERRRISGEPDVERVVTHLDGLGRAVLDVTQDDPGTGAILSAARRCGARGEVVELRAGAPLPASALTPGAIVELSSAPPPSVTRHDALGRAVFTRDADGYETATAYLPLALERRDHEDLHPEPPYTCTPERTEHDGLGRIVAITTVVEGRSITHRYEHDAASRVTAHVDPEGHRTIYTHDGGGRLTDIHSPDSGHVRQFFDATGRLIERIDATGARVTWAFDPIGRLTDERAFNARGAQVSAIRRFYDDGGPFARGQLVAAEDDAGRVDFTHDARGRVVRTTRRFDTPRGAVTLSNAHVYDAQGRPLRDIYADGSTLDHAYTARGLEVPNPFAEAEYDALARWNHMSLAPGVELTRELDHAGRVLSQRVAHKSTTLLDLAHRYDVAGQLAETRDHLAAEGFSLSQSYVYDDLRRLVASTAHGKTSSWRYSDDGNLLEQAGRTLAYDPARPHAAVSLNAQRLTYDAAGQLAEVTGEGPLTPGAWRFDPHGRVQAFAADDGRRVEHVYDYTGERAIRREYNARGGLEHETLYLSRDVEVRDGQLVRWIFFAGERIAESAVPMPPAGFAELPAQAVAAVHPSRGPPLSLVALAALMLAALALLTRQLGPPARPRGWAPAAALVLAGLTALSCRHHGSTARPLIPDEHTRYHAADRLGSAALVLDHQGRPLARDAAEPYGAARLAWRSGDAAGPVYRFTGKEDDAPSSAIAIGARHYLPALGRWASPDPLHLLNPAERLDEPGERNLYRYAANNPIANTDPTGHGWISWIVKTGKALGKAVYKGWDKVDEFSGIADDVVTVASAEAGIGARVLSALSLASEALPISAGDIKSTYRWVRGTDKAANAAKRAERRDVTDAAKKYAPSTPAGGQATYQTYTKTNPTTGQVYSGRTSGTGNPQDNVIQRDSSHHMNAQGYGSAQLDRSSGNPAAIRGREQFLIEKHGGAQKSGGTSGNKINGISPRNRKGATYRAAAKQEFGE
ncbi:RHS repeat-associated core domain-containing protein [Nannocystis exedens]|uniref:RHS repeat-associated core domain-containing protein n=1 Tax=Nannocystis exedens TaxID=54 RepID=A0A1I2IBS7_9BACT|nr:toxin TcdB middle/N-terminal domain-containing protein [Nannocystis exedens]PCC68201.1 putative deoxyribonuclease RhsA [Nannocystis exedens]SFF39694.1 RHS repeat-associated core domain-containing protein [Nannocystis exedens]